MQLSCFLQPVFTCNDMWQCKCNVVQFGHQNVGIDERLRLVNEMQLGWITCSLAIFLRIENKFVTMLDEFKQQTSKESSYNPNPTFK